MKILLLIGTCLSMLTVAWAKVPANIQGIFNAKCTKCHGSAGRLSLKSNKAYAALVNKKARKNKKMLLVKPFEPDNSFLYVKLLGRGTPGFKGMKMPIGAKLSSDQIEDVRQWILDGAVAEE